MKRFLQISVVVLTLGAAAMVDRPPGAASQDASIMKNLDNIMPATPFLSDEVGILDEMPVQPLRYDPGYRTTLYTSEMRVEDATLVHIALYDPGRSSSQRSLFYGSTTRSSVLGGSTAAREIFPIARSGTRPAQTMSRYLVSMNGGFRGAATLVGDITPTADNLLASFGRKEVTTRLGGYRST